MTAAPKAMSHGLGAAAGATFGAFPGISAAKAGAAKTANAAATNTTFFIESAPLIRSARPRRSPSHLPTREPRAPAANGLYAFGVRYWEFRLLSLAPGRRKGWQVLPF